ncbi:unnamed protein product [Arctogadus glacialis]
MGLMVQRQQKQGITVWMGEGATPVASHFLFPIPASPGARRRSARPPVRPGARAWWPGGHRFSGPQVEEEQVEDLMVLVWWGAEVRARCPPRRTGAQTWTPSCF